MIPLPDAASRSNDPRHLLMSAHQLQAARRTIFELNVGNTDCTLTSADYKELAEMTDG